MRRRMSAQTEIAALFMKDETKEKKRERDVID